MCYIGVLSTFCEQHGPSVLMTTTITDEPIENVVINITKDLNEDSTVECEYCRSFQSPELPCLTSFENNVCFVSSRSGSGIVDNRAIKHISMRSLSCESGDTFSICDNLMMGGMTCFNFSLFDENARGNRRIFSLAVVALGSTCNSILSSNISRIIQPRLGMYFFFKLSHIYVCSLCIKYLKIFITTYATSVMRYT